jgi:hypothetical protein
MNPMSRMNRESEHQREALRQQRLLQALWRDAGLEWVRAPRAGLDAGLAAYRGNAAAMAERALSSHFPTVAALLGPESFGALARDLWRHHPPERGDLGEWGAALPDFIAASALLADEPYLADSARLDLLVHRATRAADTPAVPAGLERLATDDPAQLRVALTAGAAVWRSDWPIVAIWQAHQRPDDDSTRFADVRAAFDAQRRETAFVWRDGYVVRVEGLDEPDAAFVDSLVGRLSLADALDAAGPDFAFDRWLARALAQRWLAAIHPLETP